MDGRWTFEVGVVGKNFAQAADVRDAYIVRDELEYPIERALPLWVFGFLY